MKKITSKIMTLVMAAVIMATSVLSVSAAEKTIQLGTATRTEGYIAGVKFNHKVTTDGRDLYCLNIHKNTATNVKAKLVKNSSYIDGGVIYILKNGYPNKSFTNDKKKDYYITQTAVWWYLDKAKGGTNLGNGFKSTGSDSYNMRKYVKKLVNNAYKHRNDSIGYTDTKLELSKTGNLTLKDNYYVSDSISSTTAKNISAYNVTLNNAPTGTIVSLSNGQEFEYTKEFAVKISESFVVKVPATSITDTETTFTLEAKADGDTQYMAYEYQPVDSSMQSVALLEKKTDSAKTSMNLEISSSSVSIIKVDSVTKQPLAGAKLVLKDANGNEITSWITTINAHIIKNLANGTYTIEETEAPNGYLLNTNVTEFTITDTNRSIEVSFENAPKNVVVNITKVDQETNEALAGAVLAVKNSDGQEIARFTTTSEAYVLTDIENGTYTVEEISAPAGYIKSDDVITFTVDDEHLSHQIIFKNAKEVFVPDTASIPSILIVILGVIITGLGINYIRKNARA